MSSQIDKNEMKLYYYHHVLHLKSDFVRVLKDQGQLPPMKLRESLEALDRSKLLS